MELKVCLLCLFYKLQRSAIYLEIGPSKLERIQLRYIKPMKVF